jgi:hypothetical protein
MKPLRLVLIHSPTLIDPTWRRVYGSFAYDTPEFEIVGRIVVERNTRTAFDLRPWAGKCDVVIHEDTRTWGTYERRGQTPPIAFRVIDSTHLEKHLRMRREQAKLADLVLIEGDQTERFSDLKRPTLRSGFGLDETLFCDTQQKRDIDICFPVGEHQSRVRPALGVWLRDFCLQHGYTFVSGRPPIPEYVEWLNRAKIVINTNRDPRTRSARVFEALACGSCLVSEPIPAVEGEAFLPGVHYVAFDGLPEDTIEPGPAQTGAGWAALRARPLHLDASSARLARIIGGGARCLISNWPSSFRWVTWIATAISEICTSAWPAPPHLPITSTWRNRCETHLAWRR